LLISNVGGCSGAADPPKPFPGGPVGGGTSSSGGPVSSGSSSGSSGKAGDENVIADPGAPCDKDLEIDDDDAYAAARAVGICKLATDDDDWGLISAAYVMVNGGKPVDNKNFDLGHGLLTDLGPKVLPLEGERLLALSSGTARAPGDKGYKSPAGFEKGYGPSESPPGFPKESPSCPGVTTGKPYDDIGLELLLRPPEGAQSLAFDFSFFTYEWPDYVCSEFNDFFVALLNAPPPKYEDGNISFDQEGNPVSVNNAFVRVCDCTMGPPCQAPPEDPVKEFDCKLGDKLLNKSGFESHAATSWLTTKAPVSAGEEVQLRWGVYDSGDEMLDSTVVIDNFRWLGDDADPGTLPIE